MTLTDFPFYFLVAAVIQLLLLIFLKKEKIDSRNLYSLVILFAVQNGIYLAVSIVPQEYEVIVEILVRLFYVASILSMAYFLSYALEISRTKRSRYIYQIEQGVWAVTLCSVILSIFTDEIITGYRSLSFTVTAVQGDSYWVRQIQGILACLTACVVLAGEWAGLRQGAQKSRYLFLLAGYFSFAGSALMAAILMRYGGGTYFAVMFPFATTFFLCSIVYGNIKYRWLSDDQKRVLKKTDMSDEGQLSDIYSGFIEGRYSFTEASEKFDFLLLRHSYDKNDGNMMKAANEIGLARSTLYKKLQKYKLK